MLNQIKFKLPHFRFILDLKVMGFKEEDLEDTHSSTEVVLILNNPGEVLICMHLHIKAVKNL
jgi:hypothetical protein